MTRWLRWYTETSLLTLTVLLSISDEKILDKIVELNDESWVHDYI